MTLLTLQPNTPVPIEQHDDGSRRVHVFDQDTILAVNMAWAAERPLLVRGEPGVGKSQLAEAVAKHTNRKFIPFVVDSKTESRDLLWRFDAVKRLADAQLIATLGCGQCGDGDGRPEAEQLQAIRDRAHDDLAEGLYVKPGPLWWAFDWPSALTQDERSHGQAPYRNHDGDPESGAVLLIDEIDKAESDVPNGLLVALGEKRFQPFGLNEPVKMDGKRPLVVITTNEERSLPDAFIRRCIVHFIDLPDAGEDELTEHLTSRGRHHFPNAQDDVLREAARQLYQDRIEAKRQQRTPYPGQAEYLDLVRAVCRQETQPGRQRELLRRISKFALRKNRGATL
jgi:MoxR-like ATPase